MHNIFRKDDLTLSKLEEQEAQKADELRKATQEKALLKQRKEDLLVLLEEGDETARPELSKIKSRILELDQKVEGVELFLKTMPAKKNFARGLEIEKHLPDFQNIEKKVIPLLNDVQEKAVALNAASRRLYESLKELDETEEVKQLNLFLSSALYFSGLDNIRSVPRFTPGVAGSGEGKIDRDLVMAAATYSKDGLSAWFEEIQKTINTKLERMHDHISLLKGTRSSNGESPYSQYCIHCYGPLDVWDVCTHCRKQRSKQADGSLHI